MKLIFLLAMMIAVAVYSPVIAQKRISKDDQVKIEQAVANWDKAWNTKDATLASQDYADDAAWTNAFGMKRRGRTEIQKFLTEVFATPFVMTGQSKTVEQSVRLVSRDVALVHTLVERTGQQTRSGADLGTRRTSHLRVFVRSQGRWKITSHLISDARDTAARAH